MDLTKKRNILVVGGGGREHAIIRTLKKSPSCGTIYAMPGNAGMKDDAQLTGLPAGDLDGMCAFAVKMKIDFAVVAPDDPLAAGAVDRLHACGIPCFGPEAKAAQIEASKVFSKNLMKKYGIPTAGYETFDDPEAALSYIETQTPPIVLKADGLALGKGVIIAATREEAGDAVKEMLSGRLFGKSGTHVVIEEFMEGPEVSVLSFTDGKTVVPMVSSMDHKRALDGDRGLNTGGMGTIAPNPYYTEEIAKVCMDTIFRPTVEAMNREGRTFRGCLYFGLMLTKDGPKVVEYNCRFGDPETQVVLPLLKSDLLRIMVSCEEGTLADEKIEWEDGCACCVVEASEGYPKHYEKGFPIVVKPGFDAALFIAGAKEKDGVLITDGGRVLGVTARGKTLPEAIEKAYRNVPYVTFANAYYRKDIGASALEALKKQ